MEADVIVWNEMTAEVKYRSHGEGFKSLDEWLGDKNFLFIRRAYRAPQVVMNFDTYCELMKAACSKGWRLGDDSDTSA